VVISAGFIYVPGRDCFVVSASAPNCVSEAKIERLRQAAAVFDCTREGVLVTDHDGLIVHVNGPCKSPVIRVRKCWGKGPTCSSPRHPAAFYQAMFATLRAKASGAEIWNRRKSGEIYPQWQTIRLIHDDQGGCSHFVAVFSDISAIKNSEHELIAWRTTIP
jgi:PAS domain-containing protein